MTYKLDVISSESNRTRQEVDIWWERPQEVQDVMSTIITHNALGNNKAYLYSTSSNGSLNQTNNQSIVT